MVPSSIEVYTFFVRTIIKGHLYHPISMQSSPTHHPHPHHPLLTTPTSTITYSPPPLSPTHHLHYHLLTTPTPPLSPTHHSHHPLLTTSTITYSPPPHTTITYSPLSPSPTHYPHHPLLTTPIIPYSPPPPSPTHHPHHPLLTTSTIYSPPTPPPSLLTTPTIPYSPPPHPHCPLLTTTITYSPPPLSPTHYLTASWTRVEPTLNLEGLLSTTHSSLVSCRDLSPALLRRYFFTGTQSLLTAPTQAFRKSQSSLDNLLRIWWISLMHGLRVACSDPSMVATVCLLVEVVGEDTHIRPDALAFL